MDKNIQHRMKSIRQTVQITGAQKLVAASHVGKARRMLQETRPYHERIRRAISGLLEHAPEAASSYLAYGNMPGQRRGLLILSASKSLAGGYNSNVLRLAEESMDKNPPKTVIVLGALGRKHLHAGGYPVDMEIDLPLEPPTLITARELAEKVTALFERGEVDCFDVIYTHYTSAVRLKPVEERLFPLSPDVFGEPEELYGDVTFEPDPEEVLTALMLKYLKGFLYGCLVHAWASELTSRISAMDSAIRNAEEMLDKLSLAYNRARQMAITQEITEIVAGASAMRAED